MTLLQHLDLLLKLTHFFIHSLILFRQFGFFFLNLLLLQLIELLDLFKLLLKLAHCLLLIRNLQLRPLKLVPEAKVPLFEEVTIFLLQLDFFVE